MARHGSSLASMYCFLIHGDNGGKPFSAHSVESLEGGRVIIRRGVSKEWKMLPQELLENGNVPGSLTVELFELRGDSNQSYMRKKISYQRAEYLPLFLDCTVAGAALEAVVLHGCKWQMDVPEKDGE